MLNFPVPIFCRSWVNETAEVASIFPLSLPEVYRAVAPLLLYLNQSVSDFLLFSTYRMSPLNSSFSRCTHASFSLGPAFVFISGMAESVFLVASSTIFDAQMRSLFG